MKYLGAHIDGVPPLVNAPETAHILGATAYSFCPIDARRWSGAAYESSDIDAFRAANESYGYGSLNILPHASLLLNLCSPDARKLAMSRTSLADQMKRCAALGLDKINFHPGATLNSISLDDAIALATESINRILDKTEGVTAVIENTAGQDSNIGHDFAHIAAIIDKVEDKTRVGVCIDTCHAAAAGYDLSTSEGYDKTWTDFDNVVGFRYLRGMHLNDAMRPVGSRIDRHAPIGEGTLGNSFFENLISDKRFDGIPMILETPDPSLWKIEIEWLKARDRQDD